MSNVSLNQEAIRRANNASFFDAGNHIASDAEREFQRFDETFKDSEELTEEQREYLEERREKWRQLVTEAYNEEISRRGDFVPVMVAGPSNYNYRKAEKQLETMRNRSTQWAEKIEKFLDNTAKRLEALTPVEKVIERFRNSSTRYDTIASDDPYVIEKLEAKLAHLQELQESMKEKNKAARKEGTKAVPHFYLTNNNANIRRIKQRIEEIKRKKAEKPIEGFEFEGGQVVANYDLDRLQIFFDEKPSEEMRSAMKSRGFRCAPSQNYAWQRQLTNNAIYAAKSILSELISNADN